MNYSNFKKKPSEIRKMTNLEIRTYVQRYMLELERENAHMRNKIRKFEDYYFRILKLIKSEGMINNEKEI